VESSYEKENERNIYIYWHLFLLKSYSGEREEEERKEQKKDKIHSTTISFE